jgi:hypothetical protein
MHVVESELMNEGAARATSEDVRPSARVTGPSCRRAMRHALQLRPHRPHLIPRGPHWARRSCFFSLATRARSAASARASQSSAVNGCRTCSRCAVVTRQRSYSGAEEERVALLELHPLVGLPPVPVERMGRGRAPLELHVLAGLPAIGVGERLFPGAAAAELGQGRLVPGWTSGDANASGASAPLRVQGAPDRSAGWSREGACKLLEHRPKGVTVQAWSQAGMSSSTFCARPRRARPSTMLRCGPSSTPGGPLIESEPRGPGLRCEVRRPAPREYAPRAGARDHTPDGARRMARPGRRPAGDSHPTSPGHRTGSQPGDARLVRGASLLGSGRGSGMAQPQLWPRCARRKS